MRKKRFESLESQRIPRLEGMRAPLSTLGRAIRFRRELEVEGSEKSPPPLPGKKVRPKGSIELESTEGRRDYAAELRREEAQRRLAEIQEREKVEKQAELAELENRLLFLKYRAAALVVGIAFLVYFLIQIYNSVSGAVMALLAGLSITILSTMMRNRRR